MCFFRLYRSLAFNVEVFNFKTRLFCLMRLGAVLILLTCLLPWIPINPPVSLSLCIVSASVCAVPGLMSYLIPQYSTYLVDTLWKLAFRSARCKSWRKCVAFKSLKSCTVDMIRNMTEPQQNDMEEQYMLSVDVYRISVDHAITVWLRVPPDVVAVPCRSHH